MTGHRIETVDASVGKTELDAILKRDGCVIIRDAIDHGVIDAMLACDGPVIADIVVDPAENCFPMIPSGAAHNEMLLGPGETAAAPVSEDGMVLV